MNHLLLKANKRKSRNKHRGPRLSKHSTNSRLTDARRETWLGGSAETKNPTHLAWLVDDGLRDIRTTEENEGIKQDMKTKADEPEEKQTELKTDTGEINSLIKKATETKGDEGKQEV